MQFKKKKKIYQLCQNEHYLAAELIYEVGASRMVNLMPGTVLRAVKPSWDSFLIDSTLENQKEIMFSSPLGKMPREGGQKTETRHTWAASRNTADKRARPGRYRPGK